MNKTNAAHQPEATSAAPIYSLRHVTCQYGDETALRDITLNIGSGLYFVTGASGSGKTTLLKILSAMEDGYDGEAEYLGSSIKNLSEQQKSNYYGSEFGFIWQDFHLLEDLSVLENILLPLYVQCPPDKDKAMKLLKDFKMADLAGQKVKTLSGGQKQRVAIARELMKDPKVLLADEPTSALDEKTSKQIIELLRTVSINRTVIIVTHNTSFLRSHDKIIELDKGELDNAPDIASESPFGALSRPRREKQHRFSLKNLFPLALHTMKSKPVRTAAASLSILTASILLIICFGSSISSSSKSTFQKLYDSYGMSILDISIVNSFISASGTDDSGQTGPSANVNQDINGLYEKYASDPRIEHLISQQAYNEIKVSMDDNTWEVSSSGNAPSLNKLIAGRMPNDTENEVVISQGFAKSIGLTEEQALGKTIEFEASIYNWDTGEPVPFPVNTTAVISGIADTTIRYDSNDSIFEYSVDDSFFFSKNLLDKMRAQAGLQNKSGNFSIRVKSPSDLIAVKDELNAIGIVPLGRFELVEDMVRMNTQTAEQSQTAVLLIAALSVLLAVSAAGITAFLRKHEFAVYKISGFSGKHIALLTGMEFSILTCASSLVYLCFSPLLNLITQYLWDLELFNAKMLLTGILAILFMSVLSCILTGMIGMTTNIAGSLKTGEH